MVDLSNRFFVQVILPKMRGVLVDWIVGVHLQFRLLPETLYTTVAILDRYIERGGGGAGGNLWNCILFL